MSEYDANRRLSETARLRVLDVVHGEIRRERRKTLRTTEPTHVALVPLGSQPDPNCRIEPEQVEANEQAIESGVWPVYTP